VCVCVCVFVSSVYVCLCVCVCACVCLYVSMYVSVPLNKKKIMPGTRNPASYLELVVVWILEKDLQLY